MNYMVKIINQDIFIQLFSNYFRSTHLHSYTFIRLHNITMHYVNTDNNW